MPYLEHFYHKITGNPEKPKLVFLHGLMGFTNNWRSIAKHFEEDFHILVYDQRGHGRSWKPSTGYRPEDYADDLFKILEELSWGPVALVGHSMGARNANHFCYKYPDKLSCLVLEDLGPEANLEAIQKNEALLGRLPTPFSDKKVAREYVTKEFASDPVLGEYLYSNLEEKENSQVDWKFSVSAIRESVVEGRSLDRWSEYEAIDIPCLLIRGENSDEFSKETYQDMLKRNTKVKGVEIANAKHWVHFDQRDAFVNCLQDFFTNVGLMKRK